MVDLAKVIADRDALQAALTKIERICWEEGKQFEKRLLKCRKIARKANSKIVPD